MKGTNQGPRTARAITAVTPALFSKSERRKLQIVEAAIYCYCKLGVERTTHERIAQVCGVSRPLVIHYFPEREALFETALMMVRKDFQELAVAAIRKAPPGEELARLVRANFDWVRDFPNHAHLWALFFYYCGVHPRYKQLNTELARVGQERIASLVRGFAPKATRAAVLARAKEIQMLLTGALMTVGTETLSLAREKLCRDTIAICEAIARGKHL